MAAVKTKISKGEFHNLNLVFHNQILVPGPREQFHSIQHVRIMFPTNFGDLGMSGKFTPFFLPQCRQIALYDHRLLRELIYIYVWMTEV